MFDLIVDPSWYDEYWYSDRPRSKRKPLSGNLARFAVLIVLLAGGGLVLDHFQSQPVVHGYQDWEAE